MERLSKTSLAEKLFVAVAGPPVRFLAGRRGLGDLIKFSVSERLTSCDCKITDVLTVSKWNVKL